MAEQKTPWKTHELMSLQPLKLNWTESNNKPPTNNLEIDGLPYLQVQVANGQSEERSATATLHFDIVDIKLAEKFCRHGEVDRTIYRFPLQETQPCSH